MAASMQACRCSLQAGTSLGFASEQVSRRLETFSAIPRPARSKTVGRSAFFGTPASRPAQFKNDLPLKQQAQTSRVNEARKGELVLSKLVMCQYFWMMANAFFCGTSGIVVWNVSL
jgi:hypothetical protein